MYKTESKLTVYFENPFWVGIYERISEGKLEVSKITFGAEPKDYEVYNFILQHLGALKFSPPIKAEKRQDTKINPKRMQRAIQKELETRGVGTKSQQALKHQQEENKLIRKKKNRERKEEDKQRQFEINQQKRKEKHRGR